MADQRRWLPALVAAMSLAALVRAQDVGPKPIDDADAYAVYANLLPGEWTVRDAHARQLVFQRETDSYSRCLPSGAPMATDWKETLDGYRAENAAPRAMREGFPLGLPYVVISKADIQATFEDRTTSPSLGWNGFYKRFPDSGGFMVVSAVGFNADKTRAMVYIGHSCGGLCGGGTHHLLERTDGRWREVRPRGVSFCMWVS